MSCLGSSHQHTVCRWPQENVGGPQLLLVAPRPEPQQQLSFSVSGIHNQQLDPHRGLLVPGTGVLSLLCCLHLVDASQGGITSTGLSLGTFWMCPALGGGTAGLKGKTLDKVELNWSWLDWLCLGVILRKAVGGLGGGWQVISWD